ncbi:MAG: A/G-specific adenine glycosylase, partial [Phycisphaerae bacterium]|nr:A/G-specific adenine glycosylase [Phycisphaerae bacterium]
MPFDPRAVAAALDAWFPRAARPLPWRTDLASPPTPRDPWHCLVAEAMLQQTQVARIVAPFARFIAEFPTPAHLARADEPRVMALWAGLGYYRRARLLLAAARDIVQHHRGRVP